MQDDHTADTWRPAPGYEGIYAISDRGRIRREPYLLSAKVSRHGYEELNLFSGGRKRTVRVHTLVAAAFLGPRPPGQVINHRDGVKSHNGAANLEYATPKENSQHAVRLGLQPRGARHGAVLHPETHARGVDHHAARLTDEQVLAMRAEYRGGHGAYTALATKYGVSRYAVARVVQRKNWRHL